jgi:short-subunit dehydrogenase
MEYTVITGACGGLGGAYARILAERGENLLLLGRDINRLADLRVKLCARYGLTASIYAIDLTDTEQILGFEEYLEENKMRICRLINAAGADIQKPFAKYTQEKIAFQCRANLEGAMALCRTALAYKAKTLEIINVSSVSGIYPMPYFAVYSATKRALWSFSVALREEVKKDGVKITAVLPGAMPTRQDICAQIEGQGLWGKLAAKSPQFVAEKSLKAVRKNKPTCIPGFWNKVMYYGTKLIPLSWKLRFIAKRWSKISKDAF